MDGSINCIDESDEDPKYHLDWNCTEEYFLCQDDRHCIGIDTVCDGKTALYSKRYGCFDGSDEANCEIWECAPNFWKCADNKQCIRAMQVCRCKQSKIVCLTSFHNLIFKHAQ